MLCPHIRNYKSVLFLLLPFSVETSGAPGKVIAIKIVLFTAIYSICFTNNVFLITTTTEKMKNKINKNNLLQTKELYPYRMIDVGALC